MPTDPKAAKADEPTAAELKRLKRDDRNESAADAANKDEAIEAIEAPNPALAPVPEVMEPTQRKYCVSGVQETLGHQPGKTFTATVVQDTSGYEPGENETVITAEHEALLLGGGHLIQVEEK